MPSFSFTFLAIYLPSSMGLEFLRFVFCQKKESWGVTRPKFTTQIASPLIDHKVTWLTSRIYTWKIHSCIRVTSPTYPFFMIQEPFIDQYVMHAALLQYTTIAVKMPPIFVLTYLKSWVPNLRSVFWSQVVWWKDGGKRKRKKKWNKKPVVNVI